MSNQWKTVDDKSANPMHDFEVQKEITGILFNIKEDVGPNNSKVYEIEIGDEIFGVWGTSILDQKMAKVEVGDEVRIIFNGKKVSEKTKRQYKDFTVQHRKISVADSIDTSDLPF
jgi:hypothetical protein